MTGIDWVVVAAGIAAIAALNWWFFFAKPGTAAGEERTKGHSS